MLTKSALIATLATVCAFAVELDAFASASASVTVTHPHVVHFPQAQQPVILYTSNFVPVSQTTHSRTQTSHSPKSHNPFKQAEKLERSIYRKPWYRVGGPVVLMVIVLVAAGVIAALLWIPQNKEPRLHGSIV